MSDGTVARGAWLVPVALTAAVWWPLLGNYFHFDDFLDLYQLRNDEPAQYFLRLYGGHVLIARNAVTAALDAVFGPNPRPFFAVVFANHLLNTGLLYWLVVRLTGRWSLALLAAAFWGTSPINEGTLGWYAVYGQVLATTCILTVLIGLAQSAVTEPPRWVAPVGWGLLMLVAGLLFGIGIAAALVMPIVAWLLLPAGHTRRRAIGALIVAAVALLALYALLRSLEMPLYGEQRSEITFMLLGLAPAYVGDHLQFLGTLLAFGAGTLALGPLADANQFPERVHIAAAIAIGLLVVAGAYAGPARLRRRLLACLVLAIGMYGLIAVARSVMSGWVGFWPLIRTFRYHYGAGALLAAVIATAAGACAMRWGPAPRARQALFAAALGVVSWMALGVTRTMNHFDGDRAATMKVLEEIRAAIAAAPPGATVEIPNKDFGAVGYINVGYRDRFPGTAGIFAIFYPNDVVDGRHVVFTSSDPLVLKGRRAGRRSPNLLRELPAPPPADRNPAP